MDTKKYLLAVLAVFVLYSALGYVIHDVLLKADYQPLMGSVLRSDEEFGRRIFFLYLGNLVFAAALCLIYVKGYEPGKGWLGQGVRFGLLVGTLLAPAAVTMYVVYPVPGPLGVKWILYGYTQLLLTGLAAAALYQPQR